MGNCWTSNTDQEAIKEVRLSADSEADDRNINLPMTRIEKQQSI